VQQQQQLLQQQHVRGCCGLKNSTFWLMPVCCSQSDWGGTYGSRSSSTDTSSEDDVVRDVQRFVHCLLCLCLVMLP
jgi:hypothetical protein